MIRSAGDGLVAALALAMRSKLRVVELDQLERVLGGADDTLGQTALVNGRPMTCGAVVARGQWLVDHGNDRSIPNDVWLRQWRRLDDAYMRFEKPC